MWSAYTEGIHLVTEPHRTATRSPYLESERLKLKTMIVAGPRTVYVPASPLFQHGRCGGLSHVLIGEYAINEPLREWLDEISQIFNMCTPVRWHYPF